VDPYGTVGVSSRAMGSTLGLMAFHIHCLCHGLRCDEKLLWYLFLIYLSPRRSLEHKNTKKVVPGNEIPRQCTL
jgi:hypothetical protein